MEKPASILDRREHSELRDGEILNASIAAFRTGAYPTVLPRLRCRIDRHEGEPRCCAMGGASMSLGEKVIDIVQKIVGCEDKYVEIPSALVLVVSKFIF